VRHYLLIAGAIFGIAGFAIFLHFAAAYGAIEPGTQLFASISGGGLVLLVTGLISLGRSDGKTVQYLVRLAIGALVGLVVLRYGYGHEAFRIYLSRGGEWGVTALLIVALIASGNWIVTRRRPQQE